MPGEKKEFSPLISTSAIALALAGVAYVLFQPPLESIRPGAASLKGLESRGDERVQARLWQDPFLAVADHQKREKEEGETEREDGLDLRFKLHEGHSIRIQGTTDRPDTHHSISNLTKYFEEGRKTLVMMVMTEGSSSAEGHEVRLRDRNAILSALGVACFVPTDEEHIRYFKWSPDGLTEKNETYLKYVPYEWFEHRKLRQCNNGEVDKYAGVLVLWFQEDDLGGHPLKTLSDVWEQVSEQINEKSKTRPIIIGPRTSTGLRDMVEGILTDSDFQREAGREGGKLLLFEGSPTINLWSPWATVDDDLLVYSFRDIIEKYKKEKGEKEEKFNVCLSDQKDASRECVRNIFLVANINIARTIPSDRMLVQALLEELELRDKIGRTTREGKIAIVSEWDTLYGRSLPLEFRREICFERTDPDCPSPMKALQHFVDHPDQDEKSGILRYTYFRGLDGVVSGRNQEQTTSKGNDGKPPTLNDALRSVELGAKEPPIGESQLDSMRRLANVIREQDKREKDNCWWFEKIIGKCLGITAIGVTGSDVYDKFLVLQALRQRLPEKVFFTTDLDARYTEPEQIKWTRNLIVASHFGLQLEEHIQRDVPPFRDSYQTSVFYGVLRALKILHCIEGEKESCELKNTLSPKSPKIEIKANNLEEDLTDTYDSTVPVRLFEIGITKPVPLGHYLHQPIPVKNSLLHESLPPPIRLIDLLTFSGYLGVGGTVGLGMLYLTTPLGEWAKKNLNVKTCGLSLGLAVVIAIAVCWVLVSQGTSGEPVVAPTEGISIWPTEGIRLFVVALTFLVLVVARKRINNQKDAFSKDRSLKEISDRLNGTHEGSHSSMGWNTVCLRNPFQTKTSPIEEEETVCPNQLWQIYLEVGDFKSRLIRSAIIMVTFLALAMVVFIAFDQRPPQAPHRGQIAYWADVIVTWLSVPSFLFLIAFVFDATRLSKLMIRRLNIGRTDWGLRTYPLRLQYTEEAESDWWDVQFVAAYTGWIAPLVYCPFLAVLLMVLARSPIFDDWHYSYGLVIIYVLTTSMCLISAFQLRRAAEQSRDRALRNLHRYLKEVIGRDKTVEEFIQYRIGEVENIKTGAYAPLFHRPEVQAIGLVAGAILHHYLLP